MKLIRENKTDWSITRIYDLGINITSAFLGAKTRILVETFTERNSSEYFHTKEFKYQFSEHSDTYRTLHKVVKGSISSIN